MDRGVFINPVGAMDRIQEKIKKAENYESSGLKAYVEDNKLDESILEAEDFVTVDEDEELPF